MVLSCRHMYLGQELRRIVWSTAGSAVVILRLHFYMGCSNLMATPSELSALMHAYMSVHKRDGLKALVNSRYIASRRSYDMVRTSISVIRTIYQLAIKYTRLPGVLAPGRLSGLGSSVPRRLRVLLEQLIPSELAVLIRHGIMQRMYPDIPPEPIKPHLGRRRLGPRHLEHSRRHPQSSISGRDLDAGDPLGDFAPVLGGDLGAGRGVAGVPVQCIELGGGFVG